MAQILIKCMLIISAVSCERKISDVTKGSNKLCSFIATYVYFLCGGRVQAAWATCSILPLQVVSPKPWSTFMLSSLTERHPEEPWGAPLKAGKSGFATHPDPSSDHGHSSLAEWGRAFKYPNSPGDRSDWAEKLGRSHYPLSHTLQSEPGSNTRYAKGRIWTMTCCVMAELIHVFHQHEFLATDIQEARGNKIHCSIENLWDFRT